MSADPSSFHANPSFPPPSSSHPVPPPHVNPHPPPPPQPPPSNPTLPEVRLAIPILPPPSLLISSPPFPDPPSHAYSVDFPSNPSKSSPSIFPFPPPIPNPPPPVPHPLVLTSAATPPAASTSVTTPPPIRWTTLFAAKPWNAGKFTPPSDKLKFNGNLLVPSVEIIAAGEEVWSNYLVGFFLDKPLCYTVVIHRLKQIWKPKGSIKVKSNGKVFFFLFSDEEDRKRIIEADPVFIRSKIFIIQPWTATCNPTANTINKVPIWIKISDVPLFAWSLPGICWLATRIGKCLCLDYSTERLERLDYAKCLVEVSPESEMPSDFLVQHPDGSEFCVKIEYFWTPEVCSKCKVFGHKLLNCQFNIASLSDVQPVVEKQRNDNLRNKHPSNPVKKPAGPSNVSRMIDKSIKSSWTIVNSKGNQPIVSGAVQYDKVHVARNRNEGDSTTLNTANMFGVLDQMYDQLRGNVGEKDECGVVNSETNVNEAREKDADCDMSLNANENSAQHENQYPMSTLLKEVVNCGNPTATERRDVCSEVTALSFGRETCAASKDNSQHVFFAPEGKSMVTPNEPVVNETLDNFLLHNFNVGSTSAGRTKEKLQANKTKESFFSNETVPEQIEKIRTELASGKISGDLYDQKKYIMDLMQKNYNSDMKTKAISDNDKGKQKASSNPGSTLPKLTKSQSPLPFKAGFLNSQSPKSDSVILQKSNFYAHIAPPPAFKAPPVPPVVLESRVAVKISEETVNTPLTRSRLREITRNQQDNG